MNQPKTYWRNKRDIIIPKGSLWHRAPEHETVDRVESGHIEHVFGLDDDSHGIVTYDFGADTVEEAELQKWFEEIVLFKDESSGE